MFPDNFFCELYLYNQAAFYSMCIFGGRSRIFLRGTRTPKVGVLTKNYMKMKEFGPGARPWHPHGSTNDFDACRWSDYVSKALDNCLPGEVSAQGGLPRGVCLRGCLPRGVYQTPPMNRMTDRCKNITLPQLRCRR